MPNDRVPGVMLDSNDKIVIRAKLPGDLLACEPVRILVCMDKIHLVEGGPEHRLQMRINQMAPEDRWPQCPRCKRDGWSVWMPVGNHEGSYANRTFMLSFISINWRILCRFCAAVVTSTNIGPYGDDVKEYIYDPEKSTVMEWPEY